MNFAFTALNIYFPYQVIEYQNFPGFNGENSFHTNSIPNPNQREAINGTCYFECGKLTTQIIFPPHKCILCTIMITPPPQQNDLASTPQSIHLYIDYISIRNSR